MDVREKLVELCEDLETLPCCATYEEQAEYLISNGVTVQEWISVEDRLPDVGKFVLIYNKINGVCLDYNDGVTFGYYDVTHWMPLPKPPKGELS